MGVWSGVALVFDIPVHDLQSCAANGGDEVVALSRGLAAPDAAVLPTTADTFEYWAHAMRLVPLRLWPALALRRRRYPAHGWRGPQVDPAATDATDIAHHHTLAGSLL